MCAQRRLGCLLCLVDAEVSVLCLTERNKRKSVSCSVYYYISALSVGLKIFYSEEKDLAQHKTRNCPLSVIHFNEFQSCNATLYRITKNMYNLT